MTNSTFHNRPRRQGITSAIAFSKRTSLTAFEPASRAIPVLRDDTFNFDMGAGYDVD